MILGIREASIPCKSWKSESIETVFLVESFWSDVWLVYHGFYILGVFLVTTRVFHRHHFKLHYFPVSVQIFSLIKVVLSLYRHK